MKLKPLMLKYKEVFQIFSSIFNFFKFQNISSVQGQTRGRDLMWGTWEQLMAIE